jgi:alkyldihydroxyacetonephosphate synthase
MTASISVDDIATRLAEVVGATHLSSAPADVGAFGGLDPFAVVWPGSPAEVAAVLKVAGEMGVAVGVAGHGTRVTRHWPVPDDRPRIALDTRRLSSILEVDEVSLVAHTQAGILVRHLEEALRRQGLTLGPFPPEVLGSTLGGLLAAPAPVAHSPRNGWISEACLGVSVANADGSIIQTRIAPRRATGPDLSRLYLGSRGGLGVITSAVLRVHKLPEQVQPLAFAFASLEDATCAARELLASGVRPARLRALGSRLAREELGEDAAEVVLLVVLWGPASQVAREHRFVDQLLPRCKGMELPQSSASRWWERRSGISVPAEPPAGRVGTRLTYARLPEALQSVPGLLRRAQHVWLEQFTQQGATLWLTARNGESGRAALAAALLDAGLDPLRFSFPPLMEQLRARLDPKETLVVMES